MTLIKEINDLRRELKLARTHVHDLEGALKFMRKQQGYFVNKDSTEPSDHAAEARKLIDLQKQEIGRLRVQIDDLESQIAHRPISCGRLPSLKEISI